MLPRRLPLLAALLTLVALSTLLAGSSAAGSVTNLVVETRNGQTFLTWENVPGTNWIYHIYESPVPITRSSDIVFATEIGSVRDSSAIDFRMSSLLGEPCTFRVDSASAPLPPSGGLYVHTVINERSVYYAVVADSIGGNVSMDIEPGQSSMITPVHELVGLPVPVWQRGLTEPVSGEVYALFTTDSDKTFQFPAMSPRGRRELHFGIQRGLPGGALLLHGHGRGGSFFNAMSGTGTPGETVIAIDDYLPTNDVGDFYYGFAETYDLAREWNPAPRRGKVVDYTDRGVMYLLDWAERTIQHDRNRVYAMGGSMGGTFATFLAWHHPERIAAALAFIPKLCFGYTPDSYPNLRISFDRMWGTLNANLPTQNGPGIFDWMDGRYMSRALYRGHGAPVTAFMGRNDDVVGWPEKVAFFSAMQEHKLGGTWFWDTRAHYDPTTSVDWLPMQDWKVLYRYRLDQSFPALSRCTADQDPGDGTTTTGDPVGSINGMIEWDPEVVDQPAQWEVVLRSRQMASQGATFAAPPVAHVDVTPRRLQQFIVTTRVPYRYEAYDQATHTLVAQGELSADSLAVLTIPQIPVTPSGTRLIVAPVTIAGVGGGGLRQPVMSLASNPVRGRAAVRFAWPSDARAQVELFDLAGRRMRTVYDGPARQASDLSIATTDLAPGIYLLSARQGAAHAVERMVVVK